MLIEERSTTDGWGEDNLTPLLAGLAEVLPWVRQWHDQVDSSFGASPARQYDAYLTSQRQKYGLTEEDLAVAVGARLTGKREESCLAVVCRGPLWFRPHATYRGASSAVC